MVCQTPSIWTCQHLKTWVPLCIYPMVKLSMLVIMVVTYHDKHSVSLHRKLQRFYWRMLNFWSQHKIFSEKILCCDQKFNILQCLLPTQMNFHDNTKVLVRTIMVLTQVCDFCIKLDNIMHFFSKSGVVSHCYITSVKQNEENCESFYSIQFNYNNYTTTATCTTITTTAATSSCMTTATSSCMTTATSSCMTTAAATSSNRTPLDATTSTSYGTRQYICMYHVTMKYISLMYFKSFVFF